MRDLRALGRIVQKTIGIGAALAMLCGAAGLANAQNNLRYDNRNNGPVLLNPISVYIIYWFPNGVIADPGYSNGLGDFTLVVDGFFGFKDGSTQGVSGSAYLNIATQYPGTCGQGQCVLQNVAGAVKLVDSFVETRAYPHAGTQLDPLQDSDIRDEVTRSIAAKSWRVDSGTIFFVITGVFQSTGRGVEECAGGNCTFKGSPAFCAYHSSFGSGGNTIYYGTLVAIVADLLAGRRVICPMRASPPLAACLASSLRSALTCFRRTGKSH